MKKLLKFGKKFFVFKSWRNFVVYMATSFVAALLLSSQSNALPSSHPDNTTTNVKSNTKVTLDNSTCARAFIRALQKHIRVRSASGEWKTRDGNLYSFVWSADQKSNSKSLKDDEQLYSFLAHSQPDNYDIKDSSRVIKLAQLNYHAIDQEMTNDVQSAVSSEGAELVSMNVSGNYTDGKPCIATWPFYKYEPVPRG